MDIFATAEVHFADELTVLMASSDYVGLAIRRTNVEAFTGEYLAVVSQGDNGVLFRRIDTHEEHTTSWYQCPPIGSARLIERIRSLGGFEMTRHDYVEADVISGGEVLEVLLLPEVNCPHRVWIQNGSDAPDRRVRRFTERVYKTLESLSHNPIGWIRQVRRDYVKILLKREEG